MGLFNLECKFEIKKKVFSVGIMDVTTPVATRNPNWRCPYYSRWLWMLTRCYDPQYLENHPSYNGVSVCSEWLVFSNFKAWMMSQDWENKALDKDILGNGKLYSPETCVFVTQSLNNFFLSRDSARGDYALGVSFYKGKFCATIRENGKSIYLGRYDDQILAHRAWQKRKILQINNIIATVEDQRLKDGLCRKANVLKEDIKNGRLTSNI